MKVENYADYFLDTPITDKVAFKNRQLVIHQKLSYDEWKSLGQLLKDIEDNIQFWLGDWLNYGEDHFSHEHAQVLEIKDYEERTLDKFKRVAKRIPPHRRRWNLSFSYHEEVSHLQPIDQDKWLDLVEKGEINSVHHLRNKMRKDKQTDDNSFEENKFTGSFEGIFDESTKDIVFKQTLSNVEQAFSNWIKYELKHKGKITLTLDLGNIRLIDNAETEFSLS